VSVSASVTARALWALALALPALPALARAQAPAVHAASPDTVQLVAGGGAVTVGLTGSNMPNAGAVRVLKGGRPVATVEARLGPPTGGPTRRELLLRALPEATEGRDYALLLSAGGPETRIPLHLTVVSAAAAAHARLIADARLPVTPAAAGRRVVGVDLPTPDIARWMPRNRAWPGATVVFEGTNIDTSRFRASLGPGAAVKLEILSRSPSKVVARIPTEFSGGRVLSPGTPLVVGYENGGGKVLNPSFVVAEAVTLDPVPGSARTLYDLVTTTVRLEGEIEGIQWISMPETESYTSYLTDRRCNWRPRRSGPERAARYPLTSDRFNLSVVGAFEGLRGPRSVEPRDCVVVVRFGVRSAVADTAVPHEVEIPVTLRPAKRHALERTAGLPLGIKARPQVPATQLDVAAGLWLAILDVAQPTAAIGRAIGLMLQGKPPIEALDEATPHGYSPAVWKQSFGYCGGDGGDSTMGLMTKDGDVVLRLNRAATTRVCWWDQAELRHGLNAWVESFEWEVTGGGGCSAGPQGLVWTPDAFKPPGLLLMCRGSLTEPGWVELRLQRVNYLAAPDAPPHLTTLLERVPK
jgi:hypothetical protein